MLCLIVTGLCNFACKNCHVYSTQVPGSQMSFETMDFSMNSYCDVLKSYGTKRLGVRLYGGEILINKKNVFSLIEKYGALHDGISISWLLHTNGSLLTDDDAAFLKAHNVDVHLSCDGYADVHDKNRVDKFGNPTFERVKKALQIIKDHGLKAQLNSYAMPENLGHLRDIVDIAKTYGIDRVHIDYFYQSKMQHSAIVLPKYLDCHSYACNNGVSLFGPWSRVLSKYSSNESVTFSGPQSIVVNPDSTFFFSAFPMSRRLSLSIHDMQGLMRSVDYQQFLGMMNAYFERTCSGCFLKDSCFGNAISQFQYHTLLENGYQESCNLTKGIVSKLAGVSL
ncbi:MAG: radical SAM protein [Candidatus Woesearchaeota archaeon]